MLIVDDDARTRTSLAEVLRGRGFEVEAVDDSAGGLAQLDVAVPDFLVTDLDMLATGELISRARERDTGCTVVAMGCHGGADAAVQALTAGAQHYLVKPVSSDDLLAIVETSGGARRPRVDGPRIGRQQQSAAELRERLALFELDAAELELGTRLQREVVRPNLDEIDDGFYRYLTQHRHNEVFLTSPERVDQLRASLRGYLETLGCGVDTDEYFAARCRVGSVHHCIGIPMRLYYDAFSWLQRTLLAYTTDPTLTRFLLKVTALDLSLATEAYQRSEVQATQAAVAAMREERDHLRHETATDALTGVANRRGALAVLERALGRQRREGRPVCIGIADVDHFKQVNDDYGHLVGDDALCQVARRMRNALRTSDVLGRYGGDEFVVILEDSGLGFAADILERARRRVSGRSISVDGHTLDIRLSVGVTAAKSGEAIAAVLGRADKALYEAKAGGRDRTVIADVSRTAA